MERDYLQDALMTFNGGNWCGWKTHDDDGYKIRNKDSEIVEDIEDLEIETTEVKSENDKSNTFSRKSKNINSPSTSSYSPINDKETLITRMFKGKSDRIG